MDRSPRTLKGALGALGALVVAAGCVSSQRYLGLEQQRDALASEVQRLSAAERAQADVAAGLRSDNEDLQAAVAFAESALVELARTYEGLVRDLEPEISRGEIQIEQLRDGLNVRLSLEILFESGSATLHVRGRRVLFEIADRLAENPYQIVVIGYTDDTPIGGPLARRYPTNWELAAARAAQVVRLFERVGIAPERMLVASVGEHDPIAPNDTAEGRRLNRRIEIRLRPVVDDPGGL